MKNKKCLAGLILGKEMSCEEIGYETLSKAYEVIKKSEERPMIGIMTKLELKEDLLLTEFTKDLKSVSGEAELQVEADKVKVKGLEYISCEGIQKEGQGKKLGCYESCPLYNKLYRGK